MKAYLDSNVVSAIARDDTPAESDALDRLLAASDAGRVELVTSELTLQEISRYKGASRESLEQTFHRLARVPVLDWDTLVGMHSYGDARTWITVPLIQNDSLYDSLLSIRLELVDAQHVFVASRNHCGMFVTCDKKMLARADAVHRIASLVLHRPSTLVRSRGW